MAEMMVLTRLYGTDTRLVDHIDKLLVRLEGEEAADTELAIVHEDSTTANDAMGSNEPSNVQPACGDDIKIYDPEKLAGLASSSGIKIRSAAMVAGTLAVTVILAWVGWNSLHSAEEIPRAAPIEQQPTSSALSIGSDRPVSTQSAAAGVSSQQSTRIVGMQDKIDTPGSGSSDLHHSSQSTVQPVSRTKTTAVVQQKNPSASSTVQSRPKTQSSPFPETKPTTIAGWVIREAADGRAVLQGPNGVWKVGRGDTVPGLGTVDSIVLWGNRWIVSTSRGLISTQ
jgi:hypothetical protein